jgi:hypothetical protein
VLHILSLLAGVEVLVLFITLRKREELRRLESECHQSLVELAVTLDLARHGKWDEAKAAAERWRDRCRPFRQGERRPPPPQTAPPPPPRGRRRESDFLH